MIFPFNSYYSACGGRFFRPAGAPHAPRKGRRNPLPVKAADQTAGCGRPTGPNLLCRIRTRMPESFGRLRKK